MRYVVLLRGVNVGGKAKLPMAALRELCTSAGCEDVVTYIQSGNVVLRSPLGEKKLQATLEAAVAAEFGFAPAVMIRSAGEMAAVVDRNPYPGVDEDSIHVGFLDGPPAAGAAGCLAALDCAPEQVRAVGRDLYLHLPNGVGRANLPPLIDRCLRPARITVRNWRTVTKLVQLSAAP